MVQVHLFVIQDVNPVTPFDDDRFRKGTKYAHDAHIKKTWKEYTIFKTPEHQLQYNSVPTSRSATHWGRNNGTWSESEVPSEFKLFWKCGWESQWNREGNWNGLNGYDVEMESGCIGLEVEGNYAWAKWQRGENEVNSILAQSGLEAKSVRSRIEVKMRQRRGANIFSIWHDIDAKSISSGHQVDHWLKLKEQRFDFEVEVWWRWFWFEVQPMRHRNQIEVTSKSRRAELKMSVKWDRLDV